MSVTLKSFVALFLLSALALGEKKIPAKEARDHVGQPATVCGSVVSATHAKWSRGAPTFLNLDEPYPNQVFTIVIWETDRPKFGTPETSFKGKRVCVTGSIELFRGTPAVIATSPSQIRQE